MKFHIARPKLGIIPDGQFYKMQAIVFVEEGLSILQRIIGGHYEPNLIDRGVLNHMVGHNEMTDMNGIKAPKVKPDMHAGTKLQKYCGGETVPDYSISAMGSF